MVKIYCDRCGKELNTNDPHYYPLGDAANGDDIFFTVAMYNKAAKRTYNYDSGNKKVIAVDDPPNFVYDYNAPDLCPGCMREISNAVKTIWDGKSKVLTRTIYGVCDNEQNS